MWLPLGPRFRGGDDNPPRFRLIGRWRNGRDLNCGGRREGIDRRAPNRIRPIALGAHGPMFRRGAGTRRDIHSPFGRDRGAIKIPYPLRRAPAFLDRNHAAP
jgi:hypothetical protein